MKGSVLSVCAMLLICLLFSACGSTTPQADTSVVSSTHTTMSTAVPTERQEETTTQPSSSTRRTTVPTTTKRTTTTTKTTTTVSTLQPINIAIGNGAAMTVEYVDQTGFPTGCESACATMLLRFWGVDMTLPTFVDNYLEKGAINYETDGTYAPHPTEKFVGDPRSQYAYGCYAPVIVRAIDRCLPSTLRVIDESGSTLPQLCRKYLDVGTPVMVWATINMSPVQTGGSWTVESTGETFRWPAGEHCLLLVGYDNSRYYFLDPYQNKGLVSFPRATVEARYAALGCQAVGIEPIETPTTAADTTTSTDTEDTLPSGTTDTTADSESTSSETQSVTTDSTPSDTATS